MDFACDQYKYEAKIKGQVHKLCYSQKERKKEREKTNIPYQGFVIHFSYSKYIFVFIFQNLIICLK